MKKNISKIQWFGSEIENGKAKAPVISPDSMSHLEGLNQGEFYICNADEDPAIFIRTNRDNVVAFKLAADVDMEALKKVFLRKDQNDTTPYKLTIRGGIETGWDQSQAEPTASLSEDGILNAAAAILKEYISSPKFIPGFTGEGAKLYKDEAGNWTLECDIVTVRKMMKVFELIIQKIRSVNGALVISQSNSKVVEVTEDGEYYVLDFGDDQPTFQAHDLVRHQVFSGNEVEYYWVEIDRAEGSKVWILKSEFNGVVPKQDDELVQMGNTQNVARQSLIYLSAEEGSPQNEGLGEYSSLPVANGHPVIDILDGVNSKTFEGKLKTRIGYLGGITDTDFPASYQPSGYGLYSINAFLKGIFILRNGKTIEQEFESTNKEIDIAKTDAKAAQDRLNTWADDGVISPTEKTALKQEMEALKAERDSILANASRYGIDTVAYRNAFNDYYHVLETHSASEPENIPVSASFKTLQQAYYDQQRVIIDAINSASYSYVGEKVKIETDTIMEALPGQITLAVKGEVSKVKVGDVNLLKNSNKEQVQLNYQFGGYTYDVFPITGRDYTLTLCYTLGANNTAIQIYSDDGYNYIGEYTTKGDSVIESKKVTFTAFNDRHGMRFYQLPNGTYGSKVHWAVLTEGDIGVTQWIPSASERGVGVKNLCSFKRITDAGFTYASNYKEDGMFDIGVGELNGETNVANKDMFGLTYNPDKRYFIFVDKYDSKGTAEKLVLYIKYTDGTFDQIVCESSGITNNNLLTSKSVSKITGTFYYGYNVSVRIGVFETNTPVTWSPAPEDLNYIAKTYTDSEIKVTKGLIESKVSQTDFDALGQVVSNQGTEISQTKTDINLVSTVSGNARLIALAMSKGKMLNRDPEFRSGLNGINRYNNGTVGNVVVERTTDVNLPNQSGYKLKITTTGPAAPGLGGFYFGTETRANAVFITRFIAWVPVGYRIEWASNQIGNGSSSKWLTNNVGTGDWEEYAFYVKIGSSGTFSSTNYFYLAGGDGSLPVTWYLAFATVYDAGSIDDTPTKDELKTGITIKPGAINIFGQDISFAGKITFSSLDSGSQSTINAASSNASSAVSTANSAASTANSAKNTADSAASSAGSALATANSAKNTADSAASSAGSALATANSAKNTADSAKSSAGSALATANSAKGVADSAASAAATAKNIADSAKSGLDSLKNGLGSLAYKNLVEKAELGTTIISGGYIKSELIEVDAILAGKIGAASITTGNLTVTDGSYLGGWQIQNNAIYSRNIADAKIQLEINGYRFLRINQYGGAATVGSYPLMEIRNDNQDCLSLSTYGQGGKALRIIANSEGGHAIQSLGSHLFGQRNSESWNAPGILCGVYVYAGGTGNQFWGNGCTVGTVNNISTGRYRIYHNLGHTKYSAIIQASDDNGWCFGMVKSITRTYLEVHLVDANQGDRNVNFYLYLVGRNVW